MSWVRIDDHCPDHPKVRRAGTEAAWLHVAGLWYCARYLTDGAVPKEVVGTLTAVRRPTAAVRALVSVGLWHDAGHEYLINDYLEFNPSRAEVEGKRDAARERVNAARSKRDVHANGTGSPEQADAPPTPTPKKKRAKPSDRYLDDFELVWVEYPKKLAKQDALRAYSARRTAGVSAEDLALAVKHYARDCAHEDREAKFIMHGATFFGPRERWRDYLEPPSTGRSGQERALGWDPSELRR